MSHQAFIEYLIELVPFYKKAPKTKKTHWLDHAQLITKKSRRTLKRYLSTQSASGWVEAKHIRGRGRKPKYSKELLLPHLRVLWKMMEQISALRIKAALPDWLPYYTPAELTSELRTQLLDLSTSTIHRFLTEDRNKFRATQGLATTEPACHAIKNKVPIRTFDEKITRPGFLQADTVSHCGTSTYGPFVSSITLTDVFSGWTENSRVKVRRPLSSTFFTSPQEPRDGEK